MWSSAINSRNNVTTDAGAGFEQTLTGLTLGIDSRFSREESSTTQAGVVWTLITENKQAVMCRCLFIELNADIKKPTAIGWFSWDFWSAREDLNLRPPTPHDGALPGCATCRLVAANTTVFHTDCK